MPKAIKANGAGSQKSLSGKEVAEQIALEEERKRNEAAAEARREHKPPTALRGRARLQDGGRDERHESADEDLDGALHRGEDLAEGDAPSAARDAQQLGADHEQRRRDGDGEQLLAEGGAKHGDGEANRKKRLMYAEKAAAAEKRQKSQQGKRQAKKRKILT